MIYDGTNYSTLDNPLGGHSAGDGTELYGIDNGIIVGTYYNSNKAPHGFYYTGGIFTPVDFPGSINTQVYGISGDVMVGTYQAADQTSHGFMAVIPEPQSIVPCGFALLGFLIAARPWLRVTLVNRQLDSRRSGLAGESPAAVGAGAPRSRQRVMGRRTRRRLTRPHSGDLRNAVRDCDLAPHPVRPSGESATRVRGRQG